MLTNAQELRPSQHLTADGAGTNAGGTVREMADRIVAELQALGRKDETMRHTSMDLRTWVLAQGRRALDPKTRVALQRARAKAHDELGRICSGTFQRGKKDGRLTVFVFTRTPANHDGSDEMKSNETPGVNA